MAPTDKRKAQLREASKKNRQAKQNAGWKRMWVPPHLIKAIKKLLKGEGL